MSEMLERVALAISGSDDRADILEIHRHRARLAIAAMREPTKAMADEASAWHDRCDGRTDMDEVWRNMIDAALK